MGKFKDQLLVKLGGVIDILLEGDKTPEAIKAVKTIMKEIEDSM